MRNGRAAETRLRVIFNSKESDLGLDSATTSREGADPLLPHPCRDGESVAEVLEEFESDGCFSGVKPHVTSSNPPFPDDYP